MRLFDIRILSNVLVLLSYVLSDLTASPAHAQSLYDEASFRPLTADNKAYKLGDIITVQVYENSSATTSSDTGTSRKNNLNAGVTRDGIQSKQIGASVSGDFDGGGKTQRANRLLATLTVSVKKVLANGDMLIGGEQSLTVNEEVQKVNIEGRIRPVDVSDGNVIMSTRIADAKITYVGEGELSERQKRAWWRKFLDWFGL
jgi:flagellar L-ring protein precursor FlgH